ncbi:MAG: DUF2971 domain-containing protein [Hydrotalea sp.]|nr:DUF2971 domain-containing protein [Hydrotalea sp.]
MSTQNWKTEFWELMMEENYEDAFPLRELNFPKSCYKYRRLNQTTINTISESYIWLSAISELNDPFECSLQFDYLECSRVFYSDKKFHKTFEKKFGKTLSKDEIKSIVTNSNPNKAYHEICKSKGIILNISIEKQQEVIEKRWAEINEETNHYIKVCSFSEIDNSLLLWTHYADEHKGICIEYDIVNEPPEVRAFLLPIIYSVMVYKVGLFEELTSLRKIGSTLIKAKDWEYESEWRLAFFRQGNEFPSKLAVSKPKAVYLGTRFHLNDEKLINDLFTVLEEKEIPYYFMSKHPSEYKLVSS